MSGLFGVGTSAMMAAYAQMRTASHNISNVNTPGYSRQEAVLATLPGTYTGAGFIGRGASVETVARRYDQYVAGEVASATAAAGADSVRQTQLERLDRIFTDTDNGIGAGIDDLRTALADAVNRPGDSASRTVVLSRARTLAERFESAYSQMEELRGQADLRVRQGVGKVNDALRQLADLNNQIARNSSSGQPPNDMLDARDRLIETVNKQMKASAFINGDGTVNLYAASGQSLVVGGAAASFTAQADSLDPRKLIVTLDTASAAIPVDGDTMGGGEIAGALRFRDDDLAAISGRLGQLAAAVAWAYNTQQALGRDANGNVGSPMFALASPAVSPAAGNGGSAVLSASVTDGSVLAASDYELRYDGSNWTSTRLADGSSQTLAGMPATLDGLSISMASGTAVAGDRFLLRTGSEFASDVSMVLGGPAALATGMAVTPLRGQANTGDTRVTAFGIDANDPNLTAPVSIQFTSATTFNVTGTGTGNPVGVSYTPGMTLQYNGWRMTLLGTPASGDSFSVTATANPAIDNRNAREMVALGDRLLVDGQRPGDAFAELIADLGSRSQSNKAAETLSIRSLADAESARAEVSGVNLDEEAARLLQFQQAYQAAAKIISAAQNVFDTLLQAAR
jgi:flagellar hook-associated protein 1 FlgK